jgi:hypothetical protein
MRRAALPAFVLAGLVGPAVADPVASTEGTQPPPGDVTTTAPAPPAPAPPHEPTAGDVAGAPAPGLESGRTDAGDPGDSPFRVIARGALFVPKLAVEAAFAPLQGAVWAEDKYQLEDLYYRIFFNADRTIGIYPTATYESGFGASIGARFVHRDLFGEHEHLALQATTGAATGEPYREAFLASLRSGNRLGRLQLSLEGNFDRRPADPFYGIGNGNLVTAPAMPIDPRVDDTAVDTKHRYQEARVALASDVRVAGDLHVLALGALTDLQLSRSTTGMAIDGVYDPAGLVGFMGGVRHAYGELEVRWDSRHRFSEWEPRDVHAAGSLAAAFVGRVDRLDGGADFWRYGFELQHYWRIAKGPRLLITRFHGEAVSGSRDEVPFVELPMLGGGSFLRGYTFERFRDRVAALGTVEYEWDVSHFIDAYLFTDVGRVYASPSELSLHGLRAGYGIGVELHSEAYFLVDLSLASSIDGGVFATVSLNPVLDARPRWR